MLNYCLLGKGRELNVYEKRCLLDIGEGSDLASVSFRKNFHWEVGQHLKIVWLICCLMRLRCSPDWKQRDSN